MNYDKININLVCIIVLLCSVIVMMLFTLAFYNKLNEIKNEVSKVSETSKCFTQSSTADKFNLCYKNIK
jgi:uncharacterized membrane protein